MDTERVRWDRKYLEASHPSLEPDPLLPYAYEEFIQPLFPNGGRALDVAGGLGRHAIWMVKHGWRVNLIDVSEVGVAKARMSAGEFGNEIDFEVRDLATIQWKKNACDLVMVFFYLERALFPRLLEAIRPGGLLVYKTYTHLAPKFAHGPRHPLHLLQENELLHSFPEMTVLHYQETLRDRATAELVARRR